MEQRQTNPHAYVRNLLQTCEQKGGPDLKNKCEQTIRIRIAEVVNARGTQVQISTTPDATLREALDTLGEDFSERIFYD